MIVRARGKYVLVFSILRDTGMRPIELERTRDIDLERGPIAVRTGISLMSIWPEIRLFDCIAGLFGTCWRQLTASAHALAIYLNAKEESEK